jgi:hypothetical protein
LAKTRRWRRSNRDDWKVSYSQEFDRIELPGGSALIAELAFAWMTNLRLDEVALGACSHPFRGNGWRVLGLEYACPAQRLVCCVVVDADALSAEEACAAWLRTLIAAGPQNLSKSKYRNEAGSRWPALSGRAFDRIWGEATRGARGWGEPGRPKKKT